MKAKKSLGQNFLTSPAIVGRIASAAKVEEKDTVIEIGPGKGILTKALLETGGKVIAIEKDDSLIEYLKEKFANDISKEKFILIHGDILDLTAEKIVGKNKYKLVANIPYYITGEIIRKFLEEKHQPESMTILVQREVAKRIVATDHKESILSLSVKAYGIPHYVETVKKSMFKPAPKVDSAVITIENISKKFFTENKISEERFFEIVKAGFAHKRKFLIKNLEKVAGAEILGNAFDKNKISRTVRPEDLSLSEWLSLVADIKTH